MTVYDNLTSGDIRQILLEDEEDKYQHDLDAADDRYKEDIEDKALKNALFPFNKIFNFGDK